MRAEMVIGEDDDILAKENAIHRWLDARIAAVEAIADAFRTGNRLDLDAILAKIASDISGTLQQMQDLLDATQGNLSAEAIVESPARRFLSDLDRAALFARPTSDQAAALIAAAVAPLAPRADAALTGTPTAPTQALGNNTTRLATTAFVQAAVANLINASPAALDTLKELAQALGNDPAFATTVATALGLRLRFDAAQALTTGQRAQAVANLDLDNRYLTRDASNGQRPAFLATKGGANQNISPDTSTKVSFAVETFDIGAVYNAAASRLIPPAGRWMVSATVNINAGVVDQGLYRLTLLKNGIQEFGVCRLTAASSAAVTLSTAPTIIECNGTDYVEVYFVGTESGTKTINGAEQLTTFCGVLL